jgi:hypothetical protein
MVVMTAMDNGIKLRFSFKTNIQKSQIVANTGVIGFSCSPTVDGLDWEGREGDSAGGRWEKDKEGRGGEPTKTM